MTTVSTIRTLIRLIAQPHGVPERLARLAAARESADLLNSQRERAL